MSRFESLEKEIGNQNMKTATQPQTSKPTRPSSAKSVGRLYFLEASGGRIHSANADGSDRKVIVSGARVPDGVVVDVEAGHIYWTNMGVPSKNDGSIERADLDGQNRVTIIGEGETFTPKQLHLEKKSGKLYWCDREGMRVMRANLDGSNIETLVDTSKGDALESPLIQIAGKFIGRKKGRRTPARAASFARRSTSQKARQRLIGVTSRCCSMVCRSRSISSSI
jgi:sugar lactone lactonase YvrE